MLRQEYVAAVRANLRGTLDNISIVEKDGSITELSKKNENASKYRRTKKRNEGTAKSASQQNDRRRTAGCRSKMCCHSAEQ